MAPTNRRRARVNAAVRTALALSSAFLVTAGAAAQPNAPPVVTVRLAAEGQRPVIDGPVDDVVWMNVEPFSAFVQQEPNASTFSSNIRQER